MPAINGPVIATIALRTATARFTLLLLLFLPRYGPASLRLRPARPSQSLPYSGAPLKPSNQLRRTALYAAHTVAETRLHPLPAAAPPMKFGSAPTTPKQAHLKRRKAGEC